MASMDAKDVFWVKQAGVKPFEEVFKGFDAFLNVDILFMLRVSTEYDISNRQVSVGNCLGTGITLQDVRNRLVAVVLTARPGR